MKITNYQLIGTFFFLLIGFHLYGQAPSVIQRGKRGELSVINPSTAQFTQQNLTPVNQYTGMASLNVGLYNMDFDGLNVPLQLSYNSGGVKVDQEASWVGLGWSLSGVPSIVHVINQRSDVGNGPIEQPRYFGYCYEPLVPTFLSVGDPYIGELNHPDNQINGSFLDTQPDIFIANLLGRTVKFQLTQEAATGEIEARMLDASNAKITYDKNDRSFTIIDENGFTYEFKEIEYVFNWTTSDSSLAPDNDFTLITGNEGNSSHSGFDHNIPTAWYVDRVISPNNKILDYTYYGEKEGEVYTSATITKTIASYTESMCVNGPANGTDLANDTNLTLTRSIQTLKIPKEIINLSTGERVLFRGSDRDDIVDYRPQNFGIVTGIFDMYNNDALKLDEIEVFSPKGQVIKEIKFGNGYFNSGNPGSATHPENFLRLKLDTIEIDGEVQSFEYEQEDNLPVKNSKDADFWGFYNGAGNTIRYPSLSISNFSCFVGQSSVNISINGGSKGSDFNYGKIGTLKRVTYPTGGYTLFDYESNTVRITTDTSSIDYDALTYYYLSGNNLESGYPVTSPSNSFIKTFKIGGLRVKTVSNYDVNDQLELRKSYTYDGLETTVIGASSGRLMNKLLYYNLFERTINLGSSSQVDILDVSTSSNNRVHVSNTASGSHVGYDKVEEVIVSNNDALVNNGKIITTFINKPNVNLQAGSTGLPGPVPALDAPPIDFESANGQVLQQEIYDSNSQLKILTENTFNFINSQRLVGYKVYFGGGSGDFAGVPVTTNYVFDWFRYNSKRYVPLLVESKTTRYTDSNTPIESTTYNTYNTITTYLRSTRVVNSQESFDDGDLISYYYPYDSNYGVSSYSRMASLVLFNRIDQPVYTRVTKNGSLLSHTLQTYDFFDGLLHPKSERWQRVDTALDNILTRVTYDEYDSYGNLLKVTQRGGVSNSYIWGYENMYPVAIVSNSKVTSSQIEDKIDRMTLLDPRSSEVEINQQIDLLRNDTDFDASLISSYGFNPGVGVTAMKSPNSVESSYQYDGKERLVLQKDHNGFTTSRTEYNTINESPNCVNCGRKIQLLTASYDVLREAPVTFTRVLIMGTNGETFSGYTNYLIDYGDGTIDSGVGNPSTYTHAYQEEGLYTIRLFMSKDDGAFESGQINIRVGPNADPVTNVYFDMISPDPLTGSSTMRLNGTPGAVVGVELEANGAISSMSGEGGFPSVSGATTTISVGNTHLFTVTIPAEGYLNAYIQFHKSDTGSSNDCGGNAKLTIMSTTIGDVGSPLFGTTTAVTDVDESCNGIVIDDSESLDISMSGFEGELENISGPPGQQTCTVRYSPHVTVSGGSGSYTYSWSYKTTNSTSWISAGSGSSMTMSYDPATSTFCNPVGLSFNFRCIVDDGAGASDTYISSDISAMCSCDVN